MWLLRRPTLLATSVSLNVALFKLELVKVVLLRQLEHTLRLATLTLMVILAVPLVHALVGYGLVVDLLADYDNLLL